MYVDQKCFPSFACIVSLEVGDDDRDGATNMLLISMTTSAGCSIGGDDSI